MTSRLQTHFASYEELTKDELYALLWLRDRVFVVGQKITAESEIDGDDPANHHLLGYKDGELVAYARLSWDQPVVKVGRVAVDPSQQRGGIGTELMLAVHELLRNRPAKMHAQAYLRRWYESLGWRVTGPLFLEAEIEHYPMERP